MKSITKSMVAFAAIAVISATAITATAAATLTEQQVDTTSAEAKAAISYDMYATGSLGHKIGRQSNSKIWVPIDSNDTLCNIINSDINNYLETFTLGFGEAEANNRTSKLRTISGAANKYKWTYITVYGVDGRSSTAYTPEKDRNKITVSATASYVGTIKRATYYTYRNVDSFSGSDYLETSIFGVKNP